MQTVVIIFNVTLACCCLAVARWIWVFRLSLRRTTQVLLAADMIAHDTLRDAPNHIAQGQFTIQQWQLFLSQLSPAIAQGKVILGWAKLAQTIGTLTWSRKGFFQLYQRR